MRSCRNCNQRIRANDTTNFTVHLRNRVHHIRNSKQISSCCAIESVVEPSATPYRQHFFQRLCVFTSSSTECLLHCFMPQFTSFIRSQNSTCLLNQFYRFQSGWLSCYIYYLMRGRERLFRPHTLMFPFGSNSVILATPALWCTMVGRIAHTHPPLTTVIMHKWCIEFPQLRCGFLKWRVKMVNICTTPHHIVCVQCTLSIEVAVAQ